jgi:NAD(P)-dependent dehydrogenase (short-subunit alcohol dehydrogenase family)
MAGPTAAARAAKAKVTRWRPSSPGRATVAGVDQREHAVGTPSLQADLTDEDQVRQVFARIHDELGRIDVLYNNAGLSDRSDHSALDLPLETWARVLAANLTTVFLCCKHGIPYPPEQRSSPEPRSRSTGASRRPSPCPPEICGPPGRPPGGPGVRP